MATHPDDRITTFYEWVVETVEVHSEDCEDIIDCSYWSEKDFEKALADFAASTPPEGGRVDFALSRSTGNNAEGLLDRGYMYLQAGEWPGEFDNGKSVPQRFADRLARAKQECVK